MFNTDRFIYPGSPSINLMSTYIKACRYCPVVQGVVYYFFFHHGQLIITTTHQRWYKWAHLCSLLPAPPLPHLPICPFTHSHIFDHFWVTFQIKLILIFCTFLSQRNRRIQKKKTSKYRVVAVQFDRNHFSSNKICISCTATGDFSGM